MTTLTGQATVARAALPQPLPLRFKDDVFGHARISTPALPPWRAGLQLGGNVDCSWGACFTDPEGLDFSPFVGSLLIGPGAMRADGWMPRDDFFGTRRGIPPAVGAVERPAGSITFGPRR